MKKTFSAALALLLALLTSQAWSQNPLLHATQELVRSNYTEPESLDPALAETVNAMIIVCDIFEGLTAIDNEGRVVAGVAQSWKQVTPTTWVFNLRRNSMFSNGDPVTAHDFVYAWRRFLDPRTASPYASAYGMFLVNGADVAAGKKPPSELGVKALDAWTLEVKTTSPLPFLLSLVANNQFAPVSKAAVEKGGRDWTKPGNLIGNGPYVLKEAIVNSKIVLTKNPHYWDSAAVRLTKVTWLPIEDRNADFRMYQSGGTDWLATLPTGTYAELKKSRPNEIHNAPMLALSYYAFNFSDPLLKDVRVRKAMSMVLDRDVLAQKVTADGQIPLYGLMVKGIEGAKVSAYDWATWPMSQKVEEARKLLAQAGVKSGTKVRMMFATSDAQKKMALFAASEWKTKLGLDVESESLEFRVMVKRLHDRAYQIGRYSWTADYNDATTFLAIVQCDSDQNISGSCSRQADALADQANRQTDPAKRRDLLSQAADLAMQDYPLIPLLQISTARLVKPYVGGYSDANAMDRFRSKDLFILKH